MPKIKYRDYRFSHKTMGHYSRDLITLCDNVLQRYWDEGWNGITLRQLYYQLVSKNIIPNTVRSYENLGVLMTRARYAGLIDWEHLVDRGRYLRQRSKWDTESDILYSAAGNFHLDWWQDQDIRPEIWVEKEALIGVAERAGNALDVPYYTCKGYNSQSEMWAAAQRFIAYSAQGAAPVVFYLGDHDPSGIDMDRDIKSRLSEFGAACEVRRIALNYDQISIYKPPPNPAKALDTRYKDYVAQFKTNNSWELDALDPDVLVKIIFDAVMPYVDIDTRDNIIAREEQSKAVLRQFAIRYKELEKIVLTTERS